MPREEQIKVDDTSVVPAEPHRQEVGTPPPVVADTPAPVADKPVRAKRAKQPVEEQTFLVLRDWGSKPVPYKKGDRFLGKDCVYKVEDGLRKGTIRRMTRAELEDEEDE